MANVEVVRGEFLVEGIHGAKSVAADGLLDEVVEEVFDELKTHLLKSRRVMRSKTAELVHQEFYGWVLAHYAVRWLLHQGATRHRMPHKSLSFTSHVQLLRREQPLSGAFPPREAAIASTLLPSSAGRKRKAARDQNAQQA